jgi:hypothetical protein
MSTRRGLLICAGAAVIAVVAAALYFRRGAVQADLHPIRKQNIPLITPPPSFDWKDVDMPRRDR